MSNNIKFIPQPLGSHLCIPFIARIITNKTLDDFFMWHYRNGHCNLFPRLKPYSYFTNEDLVKYCSQYEIKLELKTSQHKTVPNYFASIDGIMAELEYVFICEGVDSETFHPIYWDGKDLYDTSYPSPNYRSINSYTIVQYSEVKRN